MKVALCFLISYEHIINKEEIWIEWINKIKHLMNVYIHYTDYIKISSSWIKKHALPEKNIYQTDYLHVVPAYFSLMSYALQNKENQWFCFLTESCCPIISPSKFKNIFYKNYNKSIIQINPIHWNPLFTNRANLKYISSKYHFVNNPWFTLCREHVEKCKIFYLQHRKFFNFICNGIVANETIFAIILHKEKNIINSESYIVDWSRMTSPTSPYTFSNKNIIQDVNFIQEKKKNENIMFIRKISKEFPNDLLNKNIHEKNNSNFGYYSLFVLLFFLYLFIKYYFSL